MEPVRRLGDVTLVPDQGVDDEPGLQLDGLVHRRLGAQPGARRERSAERGAERG